MPLSAPPAWAGLVPRTGTAHYRAVGPFQRTRRFQPAGPVVRVQSKQEGTSAGQAGPLSLFGEGIRPRGFVGLSATKVGGGCMPSRDHGCHTVQGTARVLGASLLGYCNDGLPWPMLVLMEGTGSTCYVTIVCHHSLCHHAQVAALPWALGFPLVSLGHCPRPDGRGCQSLQWEVHTTQTRALGTGLQRERAKCWGLGVPSI